MQGHRGFQQGSGQGAWSRLWVLLPVLAAACSDPTPGDISTGAGTTGGTTQIDPKTLVLETEIIGEARAGEPFAAKCRTFKPLTDAEKAAGGGKNGPYGEEVALPASATVTVTGGPAGPVAVNGVNMTFGLVGLYKAACAVPTYGLADPTPADVDVLPGPATSLDTLLLPPAGSAPGTPAPADVVANTPVDVTCVAADKYGNAIHEGFTLQVQPLDTPQPKTAVKVQLTKAQDYKIACVTDGQVDKTPALLHVHADVPKHLFAVLDPPDITAGAASSLTCVANDAYGNPIADFPFSVDFSGDTDVKMTGLYVGSTKAGAHKIACVPETGDWSPYTLHPATLQVSPGPPAVLLVQEVPAKVVYKDSEKVQFLSSVKDIYDNLIPTATVSLTVTDPPKGYKVKDPTTVQFNADGTYNVHLQVDQDADIYKDLAVIVDGTPPTLTIDYPNWGDTLTGKPSIQVTGETADAGSGVNNMTLTPNWDTNAKKKPVVGAPDPTSGQSTWAAQVPAKHGLNTAQAEVVDLGGETAKATRGYYWSNNYYPIDGANPKSAPVVDGIQVFLGHDFIDDHNHDPKNPNDLATILEVLLSTMDLNALIPPNLSQGGVDVKITNISLKKPKVELEPVAGGIKMHITIDDFYADLAVKTTQSIGPISITVKVSGNLTMSQIEFFAWLEVGVTPQGGPTVKVVQTQVALKDVKLHLDGLLGLLDFITNAILKSFVPTIENTLQDTLNQQIPPLLFGILNQFAINQQIPIPALLPGMPAVSLTLSSWLTTLAFSPQGILVKLNAEIAAPKGTAHVNLGAISRKPGCPGEAPDTFEIDDKQRLRLAIHDDVINQVLHALWYSGALKLDGLTAASLGLASGGAALGGFSLEGATFDVDLFLAPILESCAQPTSMDLRVQAGDVYLKANLLLGEAPLSVGMFLSADLPASLAMGKNPTTGAQQLSVKLDPAKLNLMMEIIDITQDFESAKGTLEDVVKSQLDSALAKGIPGLDNLAIDLPALDLGSLLPGLSTGTKLQLTLKQLLRSGGYTSIDAEIN